MNRLSTDLHDDFAESKLKTLLERCYSDSATLFLAFYSISDIFKIALRDENIETWRRCYALSLDTAYQHRLANDLTSRYYDAEESNIQRFLKQLTFELAVVLTDRIVSTTSTAIFEAIKSQNPQQVQTEIEAATKSAKDLCSDFFCFHSADENQRLTFEDLSKRRSILDEVILGINDQVKLHLKRGSYIQEVLNAIDLGGFFLSVFKSYPHVDEKALNENIARYGAKGAYLLALKNASEQLRPFFEKVGECFEVPDFTLIPTDQSSSFGADPSKSPEVMAAFKWINGRDVMIRSSAVYSEDGEHLGAGVYASYLLPAEATFDTFCEVVGKVYESLNSELALQYRCQIGFDGAERMGVIVQEYVRNDIRWDIAGHINTVRPQMPGVSDVVSQERDIPRYVSGESYEIVNVRSTLIPLDKRVLTSHLVGQHRHEDDALILPTDRTQDIDESATYKLGKLGILLEMYFRSAMQLEYICLKHQTFLVQARPLPSVWTKEARITFPDRDDYLWRGKSVGVMDQVLEVLSDDDDNWQRNGLVILNSSSWASRNLEWLERVMPKEGAIWLLRPSTKMKGHIESRCSERGLLIITGEVLPDDNAVDQPLERLWAAFGKDQEAWLSDSKAEKPRILKPNKKTNKLRVISSGLEARVYRVDD